MHLVFPTPTRPSFINHPYFAYILNSQVRPAILHGQTSSIEQTNKTNTSLSALLPSTSPHLSIPIHSQLSDNHFLPHFNPQQSGFHLPLSTSKTVLLQSLMTCKSQGYPQPSSYLWLCRIILSFLKPSFLGLSVISLPTSLGSLSALAFHLATLDNGLHRDSPFLLLSLPHLIRQTLLIEST